MDDRARVRPPPLVARCPEAWARCSFPGRGGRGPPPFDLIEAKLAPPPLRSGVVVKSDVIAPLCASPLPFASVIAPPGYGKTTLLALWAEKDPRPFAWVALDGRDDDAVLFLQYIAAALNRVEPLAPEVFDALSGPGGSNWSNPRPAPRERAGVPRAPVGARARRPARDREPGLPRRARRAVRARSGGVADRHREQGGAEPAPRPLADAGAAARDRRDRSPARPAGGGRAAERRGCRARPDRASPT